MSCRSKVHHFVPQVLQRQFAAAPNHIWYSERGQDGAFTAPRIKPIRKAFQISNFYTVLKGDTLSDVVEKEFYGRIDDYLGKIIPKSLGGFKLGAIPTFEGKPLDSLRNVVLEMAKRTPEFTSKYDDIAIGKDIVESTLAKISDLEEIEDRRLLLSDLGNPNRLREIGRSARVRATIGPMELIDGILKDFSVRWAVSRTHHSFILSSLIVYRIGNGGPNGLSNPNMEMWMPISPKIALVLVRDSKNSIPLSVSEGAENIRRINEYAAKNSRQIGSHSKQLIESITCKKAVDTRLTPASSPRSGQTTARH